MERADEFDEDDLLAFIRGEGSADVAAKIEAAAASDEKLRAELAVMSRLKGALGAATDGPDSREFGWRRLEAEIARSSDRTPASGARPQAWRIAAMVFGAIVLVQGAYITLSPGADDAPLFRTVSDEAAEFSLGIAFTADAPMANVQALLRDAGARIIDGPSAIGLYQIAFDSEELLAAAREQLSASSLVELVTEE